MMFLISKLVIELLNPIIWIMAVFLWSWITRNPIRKKRGFIAGILMLLFFTNPFIINQLILSYQPKKIPLSANQNFSAGILLGGFAGINDKDKQVYFYEQSDRFIQTALLYKTGHIKKIIVAAGSGFVFKDDTFREGDFIREQLIVLGIPAEDILLDRNSRNTAENAANTRNIIDSLHLSPPFLLVTSAIHIPRAQRTFTKAGIETTAYPAAFFVTPPDSKVITDYLLPSSKALMKWDAYLREIIGGLMYRVTGKG